ncbi:hypothetical protein NKH18_50545 [Streptomyces sp. M10(2022)]
MQDGELEQQALGQFPVRARGPSRLTTPDSRKSIQAAWPSTVLCSRTTSAAACSQLMSVSVVGSLAAGAVRLWASATVPLPTRRRRKSSSPGRRSHPTAPGRDRPQPVGCGWRQASATRWPARIRSACLRTPARYSR